MGNKLFFIITCGPENPVKATRAMQFAKIAAANGSLAGILLVDDAVYITNSQISDNIIAPTGDHLSDHLSYIINANIGPIMCCKPCCAARNIGVDDLPPGFILGTGVDAIKISTEENINTVVF